METSVLNALLARESQIVAEGEKLKSFRKLGEELGVFSSQVASRTLEIASSPAPEVVFPGPVLKEIVQWDRVLLGSTLNEGGLPRFLAKCFKTGWLRLENGFIHSGRIREFLECVESDFQFITGVGLCLAMKRLAYVVPGWEYDNGTISESD